MTDCLELVGLLAPTGRATMVEVRHLETATENECWTMIVKTCDLKCLNLGNCFILTETWHRAKLKVRATLGWEDPYK